MATVHRRYGEDIDSLIARFKQRINREEIMDEIRGRMYFRSASERRHMHRQRTKKK